MLKAAREAAQIERDFNNANESQWEKELESKGMILSKPNLKPFLDAVKPVYEQYSAQFGKDFIDAILATK